MLIKILKPDTLKKYITLIILLLSFQYINAQTYEVSWEQGEYEPLTDFNSLVAEEFDVFEELYNIPFEFGFDFPFFDSTYSQVLIDPSSGWGTMPASPGEGEGEGKFLDFYVGEYTSESYLGGTDPFASDLRYQYTMVDSCKVLKLEWYNVIPYSYSYHGYNLYESVNFQAWLYESGTIEVHFGEIIINGMPQDYEMGVVGITPDGMGGFYLDGSYANPTVTDYDGYLTGLTDIPPPGWIIRFDRDTCLTTSIIDDFPSFDIKVFPTVSSNVLNWELGDYDKSEKVVLSIYNSQGQLLKSKQTDENSGSIDTRSLASGVYFFEVKHKTSAKTFKFIVQK